MANQVPSSTSYPEINALLNLLLADAQAILGNQFTGMYLHGSLALGDFNPETSDIDFLVATKGFLPMEIFSALKELYAGLFKSGLAWSQKLEGAYLPKVVLRRHPPINAGQAPAYNPIPWLGVDGHFALEMPGNDWIIQRWILRAKGLVISGPPMTSLIDPVSAQELRQAVLGSLREWWSSPFPDPDRFQSGEYQAYAILTMCRSLFVLEHGQVASKPVAAGWAMERLGEPWRTLTSSAAEWRPGMEFNKLPETLDFFRFTLSDCPAVI